MNNTTQLDMFNDKVDTSKGKYEEVLEPVDYRLVKKDYMHTIEWEVYNELKTHLTKTQSISAPDLAYMFGINIRSLRDIIATLRTKQNAKIIGDSNGYYIGTEQEFEEYMKARIKRSLTSLKTTLDLDPRVKSLVYWFLNRYENKGIAKGQTQVQFNGWEREMIRQFADDFGFEE